MKTYILSADVGSTGVTGGYFVKQDGSGGVVNNDGAATAIGMANGTKTSGQTVGVITKGLVEVPTTVAGTYNFGDKVELAADGQTVQAYSTGTIIGTVAETKTTATGDLSLWVLISF